jgi:membrane protein YdbS with pleckstrin-like domain
MPTHRLGHHVDPAAIKVWRWHYVCVALLLIAVMSLTVPLLSWRAWWAVALVAGVLLAGAWLWPAARYRHLTYDVDELGLTIHDGIWWREQSALPRVRIQHSDVSQGPLQRRYRVATLSLYTAGSRYTRVVLDGLPHEEALALRDALLSRAHTGV